MSETPQIPLSPLAFERAIPKISPEVRRTSNSTRRLLEVLGLTVGLLVTAAIAKKTTESQPKQASDLSIKTPELAISEDPTGPFLPSVIQANTSRPNVLAFKIIDASGKETLYFLPGEKEDAERIRADLERRLRKGTGSSES